MGYRAERIFTLATILLIGIGLTLAVSRGAIGGAPGDDAVLLWAMTIALVVVAGAGSAWLKSGFQAAGTQGSAPGGQTTTGNGSKAAKLALPAFAIIPALLVGGFTLFIQLFDNGIAQTLLLVLAGLAFAGVYWAQAHGLDVSDRFFGLSQATLNVIAHLCAFLLFATIYGLKVRSAISATAVGLVTLLLVYEVLSRGASWHRALKLPVGGTRSTIVLMSLVSGLVLGELTWALNYWAALTTLVGGAFLLVAFYIVLGLVLQNMDRKLSRQAILEYGLVGLVAMAAVFASAFLVR